jgi:S1-C subfamily serine protease
LKLLVVFVAIVLASCAVNTGIVPYGPNTFVVARQAATGFSGSGDLKAEVLREADQHCKTLQKAVRVIAVKEAQPPFILGNFPKAEVQFACLDPSDPEFNSPRQADGSPPRPASVPSVSTGTGFAIHNPTTLITAFHVIEGSRSIEVICATGQHAAAIVERVDPANDLALLKLSVPAPSHLELAPENSATIGQKVFTIGFPVPGLLGTEAKYSDGAISSLSGVAGAANLLQVTVPSQPGNSGGPLADESGRLVGVVTSTAAVQGFLRRTGTLPQNINWAVRSEYVRPLLSGVPLQQAQTQSSAVERVRQSSCMVRAIGT